MYVLDEINVHLCCPLFNFSAISARLFDLKDKFERFLPFTVCEPFKTDGIY